MTTKIIHAYNSKEIIEFLEKADDIDRMMMACFIQLLYDGAEVQSIGIHTDTKNYTIIK